MNTNKYPIITICGSTTLKTSIAAAADEFTRKGWCVLYPACYNHEEIANDESLKETLVGIHKQMMDMSSAILVVAKRDHIGESTAEEIEYAKQNGKTVNYWYVD